MITTAEFLRIAAVIVTAAAIYLLIRASTGGRRARTAAYYAARRAARGAANRSLSSAATLAAIAIGLVGASAVLPPEVMEPVQPPVVPILVVTPANTSLPQPTVYILPTAQPIPAPPTKAPLPTLTPHTTVARIITPTRPSATDLVDRRLTLRAICSAVDTVSSPVSPTTEFTNGVPTIYVFFDFHDVVSGTLVRHAWYKDGDSLYVDAAPWARTGAGSSFVSWSPAGGFKPGLYEVRMLLGNIKQFSANFLVR